jgi:sulfur-carrier protein adenylyltransferase/sulfurtransferase
MEISAERLRAALDQGEVLALIDVREPWEFAAAKIPGSKLISLGELAERSHELDPAKPTVMICHHGIRSRNACYMLRELGFEGELLNLTGGVDAWSDIDPSVPRY